jgi:hypothetical protein
VRHQDFFPDSFPSYIPNQYWNRTFLVSYITPQKCSPSSTYQTQYTNPPSALGVWIALEKCTPTNGALSFLPGSHLTTPIIKRFVRLPSGGTGFEPLVSPEEEKAISERARGEYILETCNPGTISLTAEPRIIR